MKNNTESNPSPELSTQKLNMSLKKEWLSVCLDIQTYNTLVTLILELTLSIKSEETQVQSQNIWDLKTGSLSQKG